MLEAVQGRRAAIILAGGRSRRMGQPKASLVLGDETLLGRTARIVAGACDDVIVVGAHGVTLPRVATPHVRVDDADEHAGTGPIAGALAGLALAQARGAVVAYLGAVDAAWLTTAHVGAMIEAVACDRAIAGAVPWADDVCHATSGALRVDVAVVAARAMFAAGERALWRLFERVGATRIAVASLPDPQVLRGCDTPEDFAAARRALEASP
jgi:molybdopterin-guanine dinucleotide biosynthesis protein A